MTDASTGTRLPSGKLLQTAVQQQLQQLQQIQRNQAYAGANGLASGPQARRMQNFQFNLSLQDILRRYSRQPASLSFHIYETHYRFNNTQDSNIIPKESPMVKSFMKHLICEEIPPEMMELLRDLSIRFYDGCIIVQVYDYRAKKSDPAAAPEEMKPADTKTMDALTDAPSKEKEAASNATQKPRKYRALLKPTPQSLYYDLLYHTDSALTKFTDHFALQMESELLTLTNRNLDLSVPLNPYLQHEHLQPEHEYPTKVYNKETGEEQLVHSHRKDTPREMRKLHEEQMTISKSSEYEELMLLLSSKYGKSLETTSDKQLVVVGPTHTLPSDPVSLKTTLLNSAGYGASDKKRTESTAATVIPSSNITSSQFMRLRFVEEIRKRKESQKGQTGAAMAAQTQKTFTAGHSRPLPGNPGAPGAGANRCLQTQQPLSMPTHRGGAPLNPMNTTHMQAQKPMPRMPNNVPAPQASQPYNGIGQQAPVPVEQPVTTQAAQPQAVQRAGAMQQHIPLALLSANSATYVASPLSGNARMQPGIQRPISQMQNQKNMPQAQIGRVQNVPMAKPGAVPRNNMQDRYLQQQVDYDQSAQAQAAKRQKMQMASSTPTQQQSQYGMGPARPRQVSGNAMMNSQMQNGTMLTARMFSSGTLSSLLMDQVLPGQQLTQPVPNLAQQGGPRPNSQPGPGRAEMITAAQQQQQQIFQMMLTPQQQQEFRQIQAKVSALIQMGNTGYAPNRTRLTPEQLQRALDQAKALQQQVVQKFPAYFQKLLQRRQQQQQQQQMQRQQMQMQQNQINDGMYAQQNSMMGVNLPGLPEQVIGLPMMSQMKNGMPQQGPGN